MNGADRLRAEGLIESGIHYEVEGWPYDLVTLMAKGMADSVTPGASTYDPPEVGDLVPARFATLLAIRMTRAERQVANVAALRDTLGDFPEFIELLDKALEEA